jgi:hypothetical protein
MVGSRLQEFQARHRLSSRQVEIVRAGGQILLPAGTRGN